MICQPDQITDIILRNPNKEIIKCALDTANKLMLHILGNGIKDALRQAPYFESTDIFIERRALATSNKDLYARLLQREEMVFSAQGGATFYDGLSDEQMLQLNARLDNIRFGMNMRKWIKEFAIKAYRCDPASVLFVEVDKMGVSYPTYKSIACIYDYQTNGRMLEYICFKLTIGECISYGIQDETFKDASKSATSSYFRFVDDAADTIYKKLDNSIVEVDKQRYPNSWKRVPGIITSDIIDFNNTQYFLSPVHETVELADTFLTDRSIRDLSKKFSGFPKAIEPLLTCGTCLGNGYLSGAACPDCTAPGMDKGSGFKLRTKVSDIARFPVDAIKEGFDFNKIFGYVTPDIEAWNKQDTSLNDIENMIRDVYWGSYSRTSTTGPTAGESLEETATKTLSDLQPIYARLNQTADWAEATENAICQFIGEKMFSSFKKSSRTYGRYYILETPDDLIEQYLTAKSKGAPQFVLFDLLKKYYHSLYKTDGVQLAIKLKLINVEPFVHQSLANVQAGNPARVDFYSKMYFSEWLSQKSDTYLLITSQQNLIADLAVYVKTRMVEPTDSLVPPSVTITEKTT